MYTCVCVCVFVYVCMCPCFEKYGPTERNTYTQKDR